MTGETRDLVRTGSTVCRGLAVVPTGEGPEVVSGHEDETVRATGLTGRPVRSRHGQRRVGARRRPVGGGDGGRVRHEDGTIRVTDLSGETRTVIDLGSPVMAVVGAETPDGFLLVAGTPQGIVALHTVAG